MPECWLTIQITWFISDMVDITELFDISEQSKAIVFAGDTSS